MLSQRFSPKNSKSAITTLNILREIKMTSPCTAAKNMELGETGTQTCHLIMYSNHNHMPPPKCKTFLSFRIYPCLIFVSPLFSVKSLHFNNCWINQYHMPVFTQPSAHKALRNWHWNAKRFLLPNKILIKEWNVESSFIMSKNTRQCYRTLSLTVTQSQDFKPYCNPVRLSWLL